MLKGILPSLARRFSPLLHFLLICKEGRERERVKQQCSVKSPLLINEYFLSREGKERKIEKRGRLHPWARAACMAEFLHCASQWRSIREHEREREMEQEGTRKAEGGSQAGD